MIQALHISKIYQNGKIKTLALKDVSFTIDTNEMVCVMGKSGSGKSTLLRQLSLLDRPTLGTIYIDKEMVNTLPESIRTKRRLSKLGYVFQEYALMPELTAEENIYLPAMMLGQKKILYKRRTKELLEVVGLSDKYNHKPKELSGGEQQRIAIARALINSPQIVFADEPTANLDSVASETVMQTLRKINKQLGVTVIFVSHDMDDLHFADRVFYLVDGVLQG
jgi:putative ABC transport system ATP-binding protein